MFLYQVIFREGSESKIHHVFAERPQDVGYSITDAVDEILSIQQLMECKTWQLEDALSRLVFWASFNDCGQLARELIYSIIRKYFNNFSVGEPDTFAVDKIDFQYKINTVIRSHKDVDSYLENLFSLGLLYHMDDSVEDIVWDTPSKSLSPLVISRMMNRYKECLEFATQEYLLKKSAELCGLIDEPKKDSVIGDFNIKLNEDLTVVAHYNDYYCEVSNPLYEGIGSDDPFYDVVVALDQYLMNYLNMCDEKNVEVNDGVIEVWVETLWQSKAS